MKFKTKRDCKTGKKFTEIENKSKECFKAARALLEEIGAEQWRGTHNAYGGISSFMFNEDYNAPKWMKKVGKNEYRPMGNRKEGKILQAKMDALPAVTRKKLNMCIGYDEIFSRIGADFSNKDYFLFSIGEDWDVTPPNDCTEITVAEYRKLSN